MAVAENRKKSKRIAIAIEMDEPYPHHLGCHGGILRYAATKNDWQTIVDPFVVGVSERAGAREYDGIVGRISDSAANDARAAGVPIVNHWINSPATGLPSVLPDCRDGCRMVAEHLLARGFRRFGYVGSARDRARALHLAGFEPPIRERGLTVEKFDAPLRCEANTRVFVRFYNRLTEWLANLTAPAALLVSLEVVGLYIIQACNELGIRIPHDLGLVICRENLTINLQKTMTLSSIEDDNELIGYCAAELLDQLMLGRIDEPNDPIWIRPKALRVRGSSDAFVSDDPLVSAAMRFMTEHANRAITVADVALAAKTSRRTLEQRFSRHVGRPVYAEIRRLRTETIKRLLIDSDAPLKEVAYECGFANRSHFTEFFRKATGIPPRQFRLNHRPVGHPA